MPHISYKELPLRHICLEESLVPSLGFPYAAHNITDKCKAFLKKDAAVYLKKENINYFVRYKKLFEIIK